MAGTIMAQRQLNCPGRQSHCRSSPVVAHSTINRHRSSLVLHAGGMPTSLKRGMSMICQMLHGNGADANGADEQPRVAAPAPTAVPASYDPYQAQAAHNKNGHAFIKVVGCGGGGGNAVGRMISSGLQNIEFWALNTDKQALDANICPNKLQIGTALTRGLGTGGKPALGEQAAQESVEDVGYVVAGADMLFITAGMGGGTGTGSAPVIARLAKDAGILTVGVVTFPFKFEGRKRQAQAQEGIITLRQNVDTLIVIPNDSLLRQNNAANVSLTEAFLIADNVLRQGVAGISNMITIPGLINVDFADIKSTMRNSGTAMMGIGCGSGPDRAFKAAQAACNAPLVNSTIECATGIVYNIEGGPDLTLAEVNTISEIVATMADAACHTIFGTAVDDRPLTDQDGHPCEVRVTIVATGFSHELEDLIVAGASEEEIAAFAARHVASGAGRGGDGGRQAEEQQQQRAAPQARASTGQNLW